MIAGQCELCTNYVDELYDASALADAFGMYASFNDDDVYFVCGDCLNNIESMVRAAWQKKEGDAARC